MLFYMLQKHHNIKQVVINDVNTDLINCYRIVRDHVETLIPILREMQAQYFSLPDIEAKREMFLTVRQRYNDKSVDPIEDTAKFFFLNRTCFNGLYRVNRKGLFNVPFGKHLRPQICDELTLRADSVLLQRVKILNGDFEQTLSYASHNTLFYFDPPYRPLSDTSSFNDYTKEPFNDDSQIRLKQFCDKVVAAGHNFMLSNSDCKGKNETDNFFEILFADYYIDRVMAARNVNANGAKRGKISEILVHSYPNTKSAGKKELSEKTA